MLLRCGSVGGGGVAEKIQDDGLEIVDGCWERMRGRFAVVESDDAKGSTGFFGELDEAAVPTVVVVG